MNDKCAMVASDRIAPIHVSNFFMQTTVEHARHTWDCRQLISIKSISTSELGAVLFTCISFVNKSHADNTHFNTNAAKPPFDKRPILNVVKTADRTEIEQSFHISVFFLICGRDKPFTESIYLFSSIKILVLQKNRHFFCNHRQTFSYGNQNMIFQWQLRFCWINFQQRTYFWFVFILSDHFIESIYEFNGF